MLHFTLDRSGNELKDGTLLLNKFYEIVLIMCLSVRSFNKRGVGQCPVAIKSPFWPQFKLYNALAGLILIASSVIRGTYAEDNKKVDKIY